MTVPADLNKTYAFCPLRVSGGFQMCISRRDGQPLTYGAAVPGQGAGTANQSFATQTFTGDAAAMLEAQNLILSGQVT